MIMLTTTAQRIRIKLVPQTFDLMAYYEPRADFALTAHLRRAFDKLADKYARTTFMTGRHGGRPVLHTDIKGISVGTRIEVSRLVFRARNQVQALTDAFRLFVEAAEQGVASGPIRRIILHFRKAEHRRVLRSAAAQAFRQVFNNDCCFLTPRKNHLEIGRAVVHQSLVEHLWETGPYHSQHQPRIEAVTHELRSQPGRYENHHFFVKPIAREGEVPQLWVCYSGEAPDSFVEVAMRQKTEEHLLFVPSPKLAEHRTAYVSLPDYERACRRFGTLWVMQHDLIRALDRQLASVLFNFMDNTTREPLERALTWQQLYDRQKHCRHINRASRNSPSFLDMSLHQLTETDFIVRDKDCYGLYPRFTQYKHATFYELGLYDRRLD